MVRQAQAPRRERAGHRSPDGWPIWVSPIRPGREHDTTCARAHGLVEALNRLAVTLGIKKPKGGGTRRLRQGVQRRDPGRPRRRRTRQGRYVRSRLDAGETIYCTSIPTYGKPGQTVPETVELVTLGDQGYVGRCTVYNTSNGPPAGGGGLDPGCS